MFFTFTQMLKVLPLFFLEILLGFHIIQTLLCLSISLHIANIKNSILNLRTLISEFLISEPDSFTDWFAVPSVRVMAKEALVDLRVNVWDSCL